MRVQVIKKAWILWRVLEHVFDIFQEPPDLCGKRTSQSVTDRNFRELLGRLNFTEPGFLIQDVREKKRAGSFFGFAPLSLLFSSDSQSLASRAGLLAKANH